MPLAMQHTALQLLDASSMEPLLPGLVALLQDAVDQGASVGFLAPLSAPRALAYWREVHGLVAAGRKNLWLALQDGAVVGSVQLEPCQRDNGRQRAEVQKLFVLSTLRRTGLAAALMQALEQHAQAQALRTLHLDTEEGSAAEAFYQRLGYQRVGVIPDYASSNHGVPCGTAIYYKQLPPIAAKDAA